MNLTASEFISEFERLGATDNYGESGGLWAWEDNGELSAGDEAYHVPVGPSDLEALRALPDGAGWESAWLALPDLIN